MPKTKPYFCSALDKNSFPKGVNFYPYPELRPPSDEPAQTRVCAENFASLAAAVMSSIVKRLRDFPGRGLRSFFVLAAAAAPVLRCLCRRRRRHCRRSPASSCKYPWLPKSSDTKCWSCVRTYAFSASRIATALSAHSGSYVEHQQIQSTMYFRLTEATVYLPR